MYKKAQPVVLYKEAELYTIKAGYFNEAHQLFYYDEEMRHNIWQVTCMSHGSHDHNNFIHDDLMHLSIYFAPHSNL